VSSPLARVRRRVALLALLAAALLAPGCARRPVARDLVILCLDTVRADHLSSYGYARPTDPDLARLAGEGVLFERAWSTSSWTVPATASLLTSRSPEHHGAFVPGAVRRLGPEQPVRPIRAGIETLAERLRREGFRTGLMTANPFLRHGRFPDGFETVEGKRRGAEELTDLALAWLDAPDPRRRFLYVQLMDAHPPNRPPDRYRDLFPAPHGGARGAEHENWSYGTQRDLADEDFLRFRDHRIALYDGTLRYLNDEIARLLETLRRTGALERTLVVVTSDHGEEFWDHAAEQAGRDDDARGIWGVGHGHTMYEELLHVPLIVAGPGFRSGARSGCAASLLDIVPTALASLGLPPAPGVEGIDLHGLLAGGDTADCRQRPLVASQPAYGRDRSAVRVDAWKLIAARGEAPLLFDLSTDPAERRNRAADERATFSRLRRLVPRPATATAPTEAGEIPQELEDDLRALGYL